MIQYFTFVLCSNKKEIANNNNNNNNNSNNNDNDNNNTNDNNTLIDTQSHMFRASRNNYLNYMMFTIFLFEMV